MESIPAELIYAVMVLAVLLFQYLMKRFGPQAPQENAQEEAPEQAPEVLEDAPAVSTAFGVAGSISRDGAAPRQRRFSRSALMGGRREVQNAVVIATILGPCRAFEPHDIQQ
jgi:hypothetical protein